MACICFRRYMEHINDKYIKPRFNRRTSLRLSALCFYIYRNDICFGE
jgi:hypothetical protein